MNRAVSYTAGELAVSGRDNIPSELLSGAGLVYSSPATLAYNSPGAEGYGVKRAALSVPESVMLIVAPGCCGRNTSLVSNMPGYRNRFFYLLMDETDLVTGRHLTKVPEAVSEVVSFLDGLEGTGVPKAVMICITCVDALLGTDMERVARSCETALREAGYKDTRVKPCYMYALTREGNRPPMVHVRQTIYSLLPECRKDPQAVNILGSFAPTRSDDLVSILNSAGYKTIRQLGDITAYDEFMKMGEASLNIVTNPEARAAAEDLRVRLNIPYVELTRVYDAEKIDRQYRSLIKALGAGDINSAEEQRDRARSAAEKLRQQFPETVFAVGSCCNADALELSLSLVRMGFKVSEIYTAIDPAQFVYVRKLAELSGNTRIYCNMEPTMINYDMSASCAHVSVGKDAGYYNPGIAGVSWNSDVQPFGYQGLADLLTQVYDRLREEHR